MDWFDFCCRRRCRCFPTVQLFRTGIATGSYGTEGVSLGFPPRSRKCEPPIRVNLLNSCPRDGDGCSWTIEQWWRTGVTIIPLNPSPMLCPHHSAYGACPVLNHPVGRADHGEQSRCRAGIGPASWHRGRPQERGEARGLLETSLCQG